MLPADNKTVSSKTTFFIGILICCPSLITVAVVATISFSFSAALLDLYSSKKSKRVLAVTRTAIAIIFA